MSEMPDPGVRRNNNRTLIIIIVVAALLLLCCCIVVAAIGVARFSDGGITRAWTPGNVLERAFSDLSPNVQEVTVREETFANVSTPLTLVVDNRVGDLEVRGTDGDSVVVSATVKTYGATQDEASRQQDQVTVSVTHPTDARVTVTSDYPNSLSVGQSPVVDLVIEVPVRTDADVENDVGEIRVRNLQGHTELHTDVGDIAVEELQGGLVVASNVGDAVVRGFTMEEDSRVTGNVGDVTVELLGSPSFTLDAQTNVGDISTDFDVSGERSNDPGPSEYLRGSVGTGPALDLVLRVSTGSIRLEQGN